MKSIAEVLQYIDEFFKESCERPKFYFPDAKGIENVLLHLESMYDFILDDGRSLRYADFLEQQGYGALGFVAGRLIESEDGYECSLEPPDPNETEFDRMQRLGAFWQQYLQSKFRRKPPEADTSSDSQWRP
jgi:hypothetical protein